jgi:hypothetical protein
MSSPPPLCSVCAAARPAQLVPERSEGDETVYPFCTRCLDALLDLFPLRPRALVARELTGRLPPRRRLRR